MLEKSADTIQYAEDYQFLSKELQEYKMITASLKKKIKAKDRHIKDLCSYIGRIESSGPSSQQLSGIRSRNHSDLNSQSKKQSFTDIRKKEKENVNNTLQNPQENNIFKQVSSKIFTNINKKQVKLPVLQRKAIFKEDLSIQEHQIRQKVIKVPIEKLVPLKPEQLKQKFQQRFKQHSPPSTQILD